MAIEEGDLKPQGKSIGNASPRVLVDAYHANSFIDTMPDLSLNQYHLLHGPSRLIHALRVAGWQCEAQLGPWTTGALAECDVIYIDLVSADRPPFTVNEILAIEEFVRKGGGLFLITDHTNCYFHNHVLGSLADRLDIELTNELLCDHKPHTTGSGNGWVILSSFVDHPITKGLERVAIQSGGCVDSRFGIVQSSSNSWADWGNVPPYGNSNSPGFYGDFKQQPNERTGPLAGVAAKELGKGRIVVVGDQNCFGGVFLNFLDNRRLALQALHWLANRECNETVLAKNRENERTGVWCLENRSGEVTEFGNGSKDGLYNVYAWFGKLADARATNRDFRDAELLVVSRRGEPLAPWKIMAVKHFLTQPSKKVLVLQLEPWDEKSEDFVQITRDLQPGTREVNGSLSTTSWYNSVQSRFIVCKMESGWENKDFPAPESTMSVAQNAATESLLRLLLSMGVNAKPQERSKSWLDELDK